jgi:hypothetical protein
VDCTVFAPDLAGGVRALFAAREQFEIAGRPGPHQVWTVWRLQSNYSRSANFGSTQDVRIVPPLISPGGDLNRKANVVLALSEIPGCQLCRPARGRKPSSSPSQFLSPSLRLRSLERFVRQSRKHIRILGHPQHDIGIETAQPQAPRAPRLQQTEGWLELISHGRTLCSKVSFSRTRSSPLLFHQ